MPDKSIGSDQIPTNMINLNFKECRTNIIGLMVCVWNIKHLKSLRVVPIYVFVN